MNHVISLVRLTFSVFFLSQSLRIPPQLQETVDLGSVTIRAKPFQDNEVQCTGLGYNTHLP